MTSKVEQNIDRMVGESLNEYGLGKKPEPKQTDLVAKAMAKRKVKFVDDDIPDFLDRRKSHGTEFKTDRKTEIKTNDPTPDERIHNMLVKLDVRRAELERQCKQAQDTWYWSSPKGKSYTTVERTAWSEKVCSITKFIGQFMDANSLEWRSGHEWSLERGALVRHIEEFILENAVHRGVHGNRIIKVVENINRDTD